MSEQTKKSVRTLTGKVVSNKMDKTITVIGGAHRHASTYGKILRRRSKIKAHDEKNMCQEGDIVTITQCRPISRHKSWTLVEVIERAARRLRAVAQ